MVFTSTNVVDQVDRAVGLCCGVPMAHVGVRLVCMKCNQLQLYREEQFEEPASQKTQYDKDGRIARGKNQEKTDEQKIATIANEYRIKMTKNGANISGALLRKASIFMHRILQHGSKKKDKRDQLFGAALSLLAVYDGYVLSTAAIAKLLGLKKQGLGCGKNLIYRFMVANMNNPDIDTTKMLNVDDEFGANPVGKGEAYLDSDISVNVNSAYCLIIGHLTALEIPSADMSKHLMYCLAIVEQMNEKAIAYNSVLKSKCAGVVYYWLVSQGRDVGVNKTEIARRLGVNQPIMMKPFNSLTSPQGQALLDPAHRLDPIRCAQV